MRRMFVFVPALAVLGLIPPGKAGAGPPERTSGRIVFDTVADGLRKYGKETDEQKRIDWLLRLAPSQDPRVAVVLGEAVAAWNPPVMAGTGLYFPGVGHVAALCLVEYRFTSPGPSPTSIEGIKQWWRDNEADLRRRAKQLPH